MLTQAQFDTVLNGIRGQGGPSVDARGCAYRGPDGRKCAAGWLIPDEEYSSWMEGKGVREEEITRILENLGVDVEAANELQLAHDGWSHSRGEAFFGAWEFRMSEIAARHGLYYTPPAGAAHHP